MNNKNQSYYEKNKEKILKQQQDKRNAKYDGLIEGYDYICCKECGFKSSELATHIINKHNMTIGEYKLKHNVTSVKSQKSIDRVKGENNPAYQHGGKYSPFSEKFIRGTNDIAYIKEKAKLNKTKEKDNTQIEYWLNKTNGDLKESEKLLSQRQSTFSLKKCIDTYGEEKGKEVWLDRQERWQNNYKKTNFSKVSQELFWEVVYHFNTLEDIYFAQLDENKQKDESGKNNEYTLRLDSKIIKPDFIDLKHKKIIEFDGTYWHEVKNKSYSFSDNPDHIKDMIIQNNGYNILHIKENDYKKDKRGTIEKCLNFLRQ